ncbi:deoxyhypusine synthase family protein [Candidatus Micrarchaeota archaeon]|nr:deoxyhypusine synthase family protein [Candidatus Micrarchaeota archaeon]
MNITDLRVSRDTTLKGLGKQLASTGLQSSELARAAAISRRMLADQHCTRFMSLTSNLMATGLRGLFIDMAEAKRFHGVVAAGGALDHDILRAFRSYQLGSFEDDDTQLHQQDVNRLGNIHIPNAHYVFLEKWLQPVLKRVHDETHPVSASALAFEIGKQLHQQRKRSFLASCYRHRIPVYSPGLVDSAIGLQLYFYKQDHPSFSLDATGDMPELATTLLASKRTGAWILGGGISKHYTIASNLLRGGLDYAVYLTTAFERDGSLSGAHTREAKSWGKVRSTGQTAVVHAEATLAFPLLYALL